MTDLGRRVSDIVIRLRHMAKALGFDLPALLNDAADEIERLRASVAQSTGLDAIQFIALLELLEEAADHVPTELNHRINNVLEYHTDHDTVSSLSSTHRAPGHTDLMVTPESIDIFLDAHPLPLECPRCKGMGRVGIMACNDCGATGQAPVSSKKCGEK
jgi:hypothetical protein